MTNLQQTFKPQLRPVGPTAELLGVPCRWLEAEADAGRVPCLRIGRTVLFDVESVQQALLSQARQSSPSPGDGAKGAS